MPKKPHSRGRYSYNRHRSWLLQPMRGTSFIVTRGINLSSFQFPTDHTSPWIGPAACGRSGHTKPGIRRGATGTSTGYRKGYQMEKVVYPYSFPRYIVGLHCLHLDNVCFSQQVGSLGSVGCRYMFYYCNK